MNARVLTSIAAGALIAAVMLSPVRAQTGAASNAPSANDKITIQGTALNFSNTATGANTTIRINIDSWSSPAEAQQLIATFLEKKQDGLESALDKSPTRGRFNFPGYFGPDPNNTMRLGTDIKYARSFPGEDGGRRIVVITNRVIGMREAVQNPRTTDYPFTLFEMRFDREGKGQGKLSYATNIQFDNKKNAIELENYASEPVRLNNLKLETRK